MGWWIMFKGRLVIWRLVINRANHYAYFSNTKKC